ncbi:MAG: amidohydrolase family protein [Pirellulaceae bacterium]|nr:amidohydrolase family protein [Pirellulaceae bacterium]
MTPKPTYANAISRRDFSKLGILAAAGTMTSTALAYEASDDWIDAHVHVWTDDIAKYPLAEGFSVPDMKPSSFTPEELFQHTSPAGVARIVLIQMSFYKYDNSYMLDTIERFPQKFSGVGIVDYHSPDVARDMIQLKERGVRGFRIATRGAKTDTWLSDPGMESLWKTATREKLAVCPLINPADLPYIEQLCQKFKETTVVIDHFARVGMGGVKPEDLESLCQLARFPNVYVKTSAFYAVGGELPYDSALPLLRRVIDTFGPQRLMWASDCPFQVQPPHSYEPSIAVIRDRLVGLSRDDRDWLLRRTAEKVFFSV